MKKVLVIMLIVLFCITSTAAFVGADDSKLEPQPESVVNAQHLLVATTITFAGLQFVQLPAQWALSPGLRTASIAEGAVYAIPIVAGVLVSALKEKKEKPFYAAGATVRYDYKSEDFSKVNNHITKVISNYKGDALKRIGLATVENKRIHIFRLEFVKETDALPYNKITMDDIKSLPDGAQGLISPESYLKKHGLLDEYFDSGVEVMVNGCPVRLTIIEINGKEKGFFKDTKYRQVDTMAASTKSNPACSQELTERELVKLTEKFKAIPL